jgi:hypothetical protein
MQASEGENESSQGSNDEEERGASTLPSATTSSGPNSFASRNASSVRGKDKEDRRTRTRTRMRTRGRGTMTKGRRMRSLPLHQRTLGRNIQGRNSRGEGSLDR